MAHRVISGSQAPPAPGAPDAQDPVAAPRRSIIERLILERGLASAADLDRAADQLGVHGPRVGEALVRQGLIAEEDLLQVLAGQFGYEIVAEEELPPLQDIIECADESAISLDWLVDRAALIWRGKEGEIVCCPRDPLNPLLGESLDRARGVSAVRTVVCRARLIDGLLEGLRQTISQRNASAGSLRDLAEDAPTVTFVDGIIAEAVRSGASDIHLEPDEKQLIVRFRIDGFLKVRSVEARTRFDAISSRIKLLSGMDIAERRLPQDGRMTRRVGGEKIDFRVSTLPGAHGESLVMRLLRSQKQILTLDQLGMASDHLSLLSRMIAAPHGIVLVSGPTGSGKTTTLYASLHQIRDGRRKIVTVEDPVEYMIEGVHQVQARAEIGYDFARALRSILRQDPDVIMIGEIRDAETARIAVQAALTGHLVFSTVHTNDALGAVGRLIDMGVEPFLIAAALRGVIAQRLVRRVVAEHAEPDAPDQTVVDRLPPGAGNTFLKPRAGDGGGYAGRLAVYEMIAIDAELEAEVSAGVPTARLRQLARARGMRSLLQDALLKASRGQTSIEEALRVAVEET